MPEDRLTIGQALRTHWPEYLIEAWGLGAHDQHAICIAKNHLSGSLNARLGAGIGSIANPILARRMDHVLDPANKPGRAPILVEGLEMIIERYAVDIPALVLEEAEQSGHFINQMGGRLSRLL